MESVLRKAGVHCNGFIFHKSVLLLAHANNIYIIERTKRDITAAFKLSISRDVWGIRPQNAADNYT